MPQSLIRATAAAACLAAGLLAASPAAQAACGCPSDGHGKPKPGATATLNAGLMSLIDWRPAPTPSR
jgi:hypothetical protein